jgi:hypothetical protein
MLLRGNDPFEALVHLQDHFSFSRLLTGMDFTNGHNHDALFDASDAWKVVYAEQKDEPFERKRQTKTFAACMSWKPPLGVYLDFIEGQPRVILSASSIHFLLEKRL